MKVILSQTRYKYRNRFKPDVVNLCRNESRKVPLRRRATFRKCNPGKLEPGTIRELNEVRKPCQK